MDDRELGTLDRDGAGWVLTFTRRLPRPVEKAWRAVTEPEHLAAWFPREIVGERRSGAALRFVTDGDERVGPEAATIGPPS